MIYSVGQADRQRTSEFEPLEYFLQGGHFYEQTLECICYPYVAAGLD